MQSHHRKAMLCSRNNSRLSFACTYMNFLINLLPANQDCQAFANSLEQDQTSSNLASGLVPSCLPLSQYVFQILSKWIEI